MCNVEPAPGRVYRDRVGILVGRYGRRGKRREYRFSFQDVVLLRTAYSLQAAQIMNDDMAAAQTAHPDRLRWFASLPWQYPDLALAELERGCKAGASGVRWRSIPSSTPSRYSRPR